MRVDGRAQDLPVALINRPREAARVPNEDLVQVPSEAYHEKFDQHPTTFPREVSLLTALIQKGNTWGIPRQVHDLEGGELFVDYGVHR